MAIPCRDRVGHRPEWVLLDCNWCRLNSRDPGWPTPGRHTVSCKICRVAWRSTAKYVEQLPTLVLAEYIDPVQDRINDLCQRHPLVTELTYHIEWSALAGLDFSGHSVSFLHSVANRFVVDGRLTDRQLSAVEHIVREKIYLANRKQAEHESLRAREVSYGTRLAPQGQQIVIGRVERVWRATQASDAGSPVWKMLMRADDGFTVESTIPAGFLRALKPHRLIGRRIELHARLSRQSSDWSAAWGSYPKRSCALLD